MHGGIVTRYLPGGQVFLPYQIKVRNMRVAEKQAHWDMKPDSHGPREAEQLQQTPHRGLEIQQTPTRLEQLKDLKGTQG